MVMMLGRRTPRLIMRQCFGPTSKGNRPKETSSSSSTNKSTTGESILIDPVEEIANSVGVRLTKNEMLLLRENVLKDHAAARNNGSTAEIRQEFQKVGQQALTKKATREICLNSIANPGNPWDKWGVRVIHFFDYAGTALFAVVGTQVAGDVGMNMVGCTLVGCVAALGGGSLNAVLYGGASTLLGAQGVRWVANPSYLLVAIASSVVTFFCWPHYCKVQANHYIENVIGEENLDQVTGHIGKEAFLDAWKRNEQFRKTIRDALPHVQSSSELLTQWKHQHANRIPDHEVAQTLHVIEQEEIKDGLIYFDAIDDDSSGDIDRKELRRLVQHQFHHGWETYWLDTMGLSSLSIAAVIMAIRVGLHPVVAATSGVTVCFGGIFRDLLCGRDLAIGGQSYAFCTGASSTMYVLLRELALRRILSIPLVTRTFLSAGTCVGLRGWEWFRGEPLLAPMHGREDVP